jgi:hypothetical protein
MICVGDSTKIETRSDSCDIHYISQLASFLVFDHITRVLISNRNLKYLRLQLLNIEGSNHYPDLKKL